METAQAQEDEAAMRELEGAEDASNDDGLRAKLISLHDLKARKKDLEAQQSETEKTIQVLELDCYETMATKGIKSMGLSIPDIGNFLFVRSVKPRASLPEEHRQNVYAILEQKEPGIVKPYVNPQTFEAMIREALDPKNEKPSWFDDIIPFVKRWDQKNVQVRKAAGSDAK